MMAKEAFLKGKLGNNDFQLPISKETLCFIIGRDAQGNYIGRIVGGASAGLRFPAYSTRELTEEEKISYHGQKIGQTIVETYVVSTKDRLN